MGSLVRFMVVAASKSSLTVNTVYAVTHSSLVVGKVALGTLKVGAILTGGLVVSALDPSTPYVSQTVTDVLHYVAMAGHSLGEIH